MDIVERIKTPRLYITLASNEVMEQVIAAESEPEMQKAYGEMLQGAIEHPDIREFYAMWRIGLRANPEVFIGDVCFKGLDAQGRVEIGYGVYPQYEKNGYATEAVKAMVNWAIKKPGVNCIEAEAEADNVASLRVLEKCNFVPNGQTGEEGPRFVCMFD